MFIHTDAEKKAAGKEAHKRHLNGESDVEIAEALSMELWQVTQLREQHANSVPTPEQEAARKTAIARAEHDLAELAFWQEELRRVYADEMIDVEKAGRLAAQLVKTRTDVGMRYAKLLDLDSPLKMNVTSNTKLDDEILELSKQFGAREESDLPLD